MVYYFLKSRNTVIIGTAAFTIIGCLIFLLFFRQREKVEIAYILIPVISLYIAVYIGKLVAYRKYQEILLLLYQKLDVKTFTEEAEKLLRAKFSKKEKGLLILHLSNGYLAAGDAGKAENILTENMSLAGRLGMGMEFSSNIISALLQSKELEAAEAAISDLKKIVGTQKDKNTKLKLQKTLAYQQACLETLKGSGRHLEILEKDYLNSKSTLHKINVGGYLMKLYRETGQTEKGEQIKDYVLQHGNGHYLAQTIGL